MEWTIITSHFFLKNKSCSILYQKTIAFGSMYKIQVELSEGRLLKFSDNSRLYYFFKLILTNFTNMIPNLKTEFNLKLTHKSTK